jgi:iron(III) transport system substrate-binding protein
LVADADAPTSFEDFADPKWKGKLIAEPRDSELLAGLVLKYNGDKDKAVELLKRIAANDVQFHQGHSALTQLLLSGQATACITCYAHQYPSEIEKGAPVDWMKTEGFAFFRAYGMFKNAPHANATKLFWRWAASEEGQNALAEAGLEPARPGVTPAVRTRPDNVYTLGSAEIRALPTDYDPVWEEIFGLR